MPGRLTNMFNKLKAFDLRRPFLHGVQALSEFIYPPECVYCNESLDNYKEMLCASCIGSLDVASEVRVHQGVIDFEHLRHPPNFDTVLAGWAYSPIVSELIHQLKYEQRRRIADYMGCELGAILSSYAAVWGNPVLLPVPLHRVRLRERGYNQSLLLAEKIAHEAGLLVQSRLLLRKRQTETQTMLNATARQKNVGGAFTLESHVNIEGESFLLVDDVVTTGATMDACAEVLKGAGAAKVFGIAISRPGFDRSC